MNWLFLALLAPAIYSIVNFIDKYVIESKVRDYRGMIIYGAITGFVVGTIFWLVVRRPILSLSDLLLVLSAGIISMISYYVYWIALSKNQTSLVIILFQMGAIFTLLFAFLFLKETISATQLVGFIFVIFAAVALSLKKKIEKFKLSSVFYLMLIVTFLQAIANVLIKFTIDKNSFVKIFPYESWGLAIGGLLLYLFIKSIREAFNESFFTAGKKVVPIMFGNELIFTTGDIVRFLAISLGPVALVNVIGGTRSFYGILYGVILTLIAPKIFKEDITKKGLFRKIIFSAILFFGILLIG